MYHCLMDIDRVVGLPINFPYEWVVTVTLAMCGYVFLRGDSCCCKDGLDVSQRINLWIVFLIRFFCRGWF